MGVPQGGPLSPLLANILLDELDQELELWSVAENIIFEENSA
jgi:retron-type reverse transcriptase